MEKEMIFPKEITDANPEFGTLKLIDKVGTLTAQVYANGKTSTRTLGVNADVLSTENFDEYAEKAKKVQKELYQNCKEVPSIEASLLAIEIAKYCTPKTKSAIKAEIKKGRDKETSNILIGF